MTSAQALPRPEWLTDEDERPHVAGDAPNWSENYLTYFWSPETGVGAYMHLSRLPGELARWDEIMFVALPDGRWLATRSVSPQRAVNGVEVNGMRWTCDVSYASWTKRFQGMAQLVTTEDLEAGALPDGYGVPVELELRCTGMSLTYDWGTDQLVQSWATGHYEQQFLAEGSLRYGDQTVAINGTGLRDHSWGPRDYTKLGYSTWISGQFPDSGRCFMVARVTGVPPAPELVHGLTCDRERRYDVTPSELRIAHSIESGTARSATASRSTPSTCTRDPGLRSSRSGQVWKDRHGMGWSDEIDVADESFHECSPDPYWSENSLFGFTVPERNLCGFVYFYFRPNMDLVVGGPEVWDHTGEDVYNCRYFGRDQHLAFPRGAQMFDFELSNSLTCRMIDPQQEYRLGYDRHGFKLDLTWTAVAEPHYMKLSPSGEEQLGISNWVNRHGDFSVGHYEHAGRFQGMIDLDGEVIEIDCGALRDRGWGPRNADVANPLRGGWPYVFDGPDSGWHLYDPQTALSFEEDPLEGTMETVTTGFYIRDGVKSQVVEGTRRAQRGRDGRVLRQTIDCVDELGRELHAEGESLNWLKWPHNSDLVNWWSLVRWEYDGRVAYGEDQDFMSCRHYRRYWLRKLEHDPGLLNCIPGRA